MATKPPDHIVRDTFTAHFLLGAEDDPETIDNIDVMITLNDGSRRSATILTLDRIWAIMQRWQESGEYASGTYFTCPDLVIVRKAGIPAIMEVLDYVVANDPDSLVPIPED
ncbi:hypothetical protein [Nocardia carnea]|uniref:hypothetical protein n=1 Tax=Nocardia carnea TaxID=37328 RepID=UPI0024589642|nr:hypothetical protein [Nocardia carnea]